MSPVRSESPVVALGRAQRRGAKSKTKVSRRPMPGKADAYEVQVNGRRAGYVQREGNGKWSTVYTAGGYSKFLGIIYQRPLAVREIAVAYCLEAERRLLADLKFARVLTRHYWPDGRITGVLVGVTNSLKLEELTVEEAEDIATSLLSRMSASPRKDDPDEQ